MQCKRYQSNFEKQCPNADARLKSAIIKYADDNDKVMNQVETKKKNNKDIQRRLPFQWLLPILTPVHNIGYKKKKKRK